MFIKDDLAEYSDNATFKPFFATKRLFSNYIGYTNPYTFSEWEALPADYHVAALYVQFYPEIYKAWNKSKRDYFKDEHDGVEIIIQYLTKNVSKIMEDPKRFSAAYIYRVAYNCIAALSRNDSHIGPFTYRHMHECSNIVTQSTNGTTEELDLFDTIPSVIDIDIIIDADVIEQHRDSFWKIIDNLNPDSRAVVNSLLGKSSKRKVTDEKRAEIMAELRDLLKDYQTVEW